jgi:Rieske Fe-S protein
MENNSELVGRRDFLKKSGLIIGMSLPLLSLLTVSCEHDPPTSSILSLGNEILDISKYPALQNINGWLSLTFTGKNNEYPVIIIRESNTDFLVLSSKCQHQGCPVGSPNDQKEIICPCHGSVYSAIDGSVIHGPATRGLPNFKNSFNPQTNILTIF